MKAEIIALAMGLLLISPQITLAQNYPDRPISFVVPFSPGGSADLTARIVGKELSDKYKQSVVVENRPGAGGNVGGDYVARSKPDGYTIMLGTLGINATYSIYSNLTYDPGKDLAPVNLMVEMPNILVVPKGSPIHTVKDYLELAKQKPGLVTVGSAGFGSSTHMAAELFQYYAKVKLQHVPYKGSAPAMSDLIGGQIDSMFENLPTALQYIQSGQIRAIAVTGPERVKSLPAIPTVAESGVPDYEFTAWFTLNAPAKTPIAILKKLNHDVNEVLHSEKLAPRWAALGITPMSGSLEEVDKRLQRERVMWAKVIKAQDLKLK